MQMTPTEIVSSFRRAENKKDQIGILAELNACDKETACEVLRQQGVDASEIPDIKKKVIVVENQDKKGGAKMGRTPKASATETPEVQEKQESQEPAIDKRVVPKAVINVVKAEINRLEVMVEEAQEQIGELLEFLNGAE